MRTLTIPAALLLATVFAAGCSDQTAPTELSEGEFGPDFNEAPIVFTDLGFEETDVNPCTEADHTHLIDTTIRVHEFVNGKNFHVSAHAQFDEVTDDGFSGSTSPAHFALNDAGSFTITDVFSVNLSNDSHQRIHLRFQAHITITDGDVVRVFIEKLSSRCVGNPNA